MKDENTNTKAIEALTWLTRRGYTVSLSHDPVRMVCDAVAKHVADDSDHSVSVGSVGTAGAFATALLILQFEVKAAEFAK